MTVPALTPHTALRILEQYLADKSPDGNPAEVVDALNALWHYMSDLPSVPTEPVE